MLFITDGLPRGLGYLELDHRAGGHAPAGLPKHFEADTYTCTHCSAVVVMNPNRVRERYKCKGCNHHICDNCAAAIQAGGQCLTMQEKYELHLESLRNHFLDGFLGYDMQTGKPVTTNPLGDNSGHLA
jgi:hypothetical protein